jgi:Flp pilus assembly protein TadD
LKRLPLALSIVLVAACTRSEESRPRPPKPAFKQVPVTSGSPAALAAFRDGQRLLDNLRMAEAAERFRKAVELDSNFAQAVAFLGAFTPGPEGRKLIDRAMSLAGNLPEPEQLMIRLTMADKCEDPHEARGLLRILADLAPEDWRVQLRLGHAAFRDKKWDEATAAFRRAADLNPGGGEPYNMLGYALAFQGKFDEAIAQLRKYAAMRPREPNPQDSIGEVLMLAGRLGEAEAQFRSALEISPRFWKALEGIAIIRAVRGDWPGAREALARAREVASLPQEKASIDRMLALALAAEGKRDRAMKILDDLERMAERNKLEYFWPAVAIWRAWGFVFFGEPARALAEVEVFFRRLQKVQHRGIRVAEQEFEGNVVRAIALARARKTAEARKTLQRAAEMASKLPAAERRRSVLSYAKGEVALAEGDGNAAVRHFSRCWDEHTPCRVELALAQKRLGALAAARVTRAKILRTIHREMGYVFDRQRLLTAWAETP